MIYNDNRPEGVRGTIYLSCLLLFAGYQLINAFVPNSDMIVGVRLLAMSIYGGVCYIYAKDAWIAFRAAKPERTDFLILGIWLSFFSQFLQNVYAVTARLAGMPAWFLNSEILGPCVLISVVAGILHIAMPDALRGQVPRRNRYALGLGVACAVLVLGAVTASKPDINPYLEPLRPWIGDFWHTGAGPQVHPEVGHG